MTPQEQLKLKLKQAALKAAAAKAKEKLQSAPKSSTSKGTATKHKDTPKVSGGAAYVIPAAFKAAIEKYIATRPDVDTRKAGKSIDKCCEYIYDKMRREAEKERKNGSGMIGLFHENDEIYSMAVHYFDESDEELKKEAEDEKD